MGLDGLGRIERVRAQPRHAAEQDDHHARDRPDDELDGAGKLPVGPVMGAGVRGAEPPGEGEGREDRRHADRQHDGQRVDQDRALGLSHRAARIEESPVAGRQHERQRYDGAPPQRRSRPRRVAPVSRGAEIATIRDAHDANAAWSALPVTGRSRSIRPDSGRCVAFHNHRGSRRKAMPDISSVNTMPRARGYAGARRRSRSVERSRNAPLRTVHFLATGDGLALREETAWHLDRRQSHGLARTARHAYHRDHLDVRRRSAATIPDT